MAKEPYENVAIDLASRITLAIKELIETKHLYQFVSLDAEIAEIKVRVDAGGYTSAENMAVDEIRIGLLQKAFANILHVLWAPCRERGIQNPINMSGQLGSGIGFQLPSVKLHCPTCDRLEPHNPVFDHHLPSAHGMTPRYVGDEHKQWFSLGYECQSCKKPPVVFFVQLVGYKLTLCGRSPIEAIALPPFIPKERRKFYSSAILAHQSGQTLAGLFLLRTFLEQTARSVVKDPSQYGNGDALMEAYMDSVNENVRREFPSMRSLYGELSADLHTATGSAELFTSAIEEMNTHFEAKQIYGKLKA